MSLFLVWIDTDCKYCEGKGTLEWEELAPGHIPRFGGPKAPTVKRRKICTCLKFVPRQEEGSE